MNSNFEFCFVNQECPLHGCPRPMDREQLYGRHSTVTPMTDDGYPVMYQNTRMKRNRFLANRSRMNISVHQFFANALGSSSIDGVNYIASSESICRKIIWSIVLICCACGFCYQTFLFARLYNSRPSMVEIQVENDGDAVFPAVTLCNYNRIRKTEYCKYHPEKCRSNSIENMTVSEKEINELLMQFLEKNQSEVRRQLGHSKELLLSCIFKGRPSLGEEECLQSFVYFYDPDFGNCYTLPSKDSQGRSLEASEADYWQEANDLSLLVDIEPQESMEEKREPGMLITVHSGANYPDIHTDGLLVEVGLSYTFAVQKTTIELLPLPYKTNCTDFGTLPWKNGDAQLTSRMCTVGCSQYFQLNQCGYVTKDLSLFFEYLPWNSSEITPDRVQCASNVEENTKSYCRSLCGVPCIDGQFEVTLGDTILTEREISDHHLGRWQKRSWEQKMKNLAFVRIFYKTLEHKIFRHTPKYETLELFSYLGGYSGVWLGFSLLTVYELMEILFATGKFAVRKYKRKLHLKKVFKKTTRTVVRNYKKNHRTRWN